MTWEELIHQLQGIPNERRIEKAVFLTNAMDEETQAWEIDAVNLTQAAEDSVNEVLDENSIWDLNRPDYLDAITITP